MPRKSTIYTNEHPYHIVARSNNRDWFDLPLDECFHVFTNIMLILKQRYKFSFHAFVLMDNHFHMILSTELSNISQGMRYFMTETARGIRLKSHRTNHVYGGRYRPSLITSSIYYSHCIKYLYQNPVVANKVLRVEDYKWSTISSVGNKMIELIEEPTTGHNCLLPNSHEKILSWYNTPSEKILYNQISKAIRKSVFKMSSDKNSGKQAVLPKSNSDSLLP